MMLGSFLPLFFLPSYAHSHGMSTRLAGYLPSILNGASFFGRVIPGIAADKFGRLNMLSASGLGTGILTFCFPKVHSNAAIIAFAALYGFTYGGIVSLMTVTLAMVPKNARDRHLHGDGDVRHFVRGIDRSAHRWSLRVTLWRI
jgi:MFS family permease